MEEDQASQQGKALSSSSSSPYANKSTDKSPIGESKDSLVMLPTPGKSGVITTYAEWMRQKAGSGSKSTPSAISAKSKPSISKKVHKARAPAAGQKAVSTSGTKSKSNAATPKSKKAVGTPSKAATKSSKTVKMTANRLRKIQELSETEKAQKIALAKLKSTFSKLERQYEEVKFPTSDELITTVDPTGPKPTPLPHPKTVMNFPPHLVPDLLMVWDFLFTFSREISLKPFELDEFIDTLRYKGDHSPIMSEICCALLRTLLGDANICQRVYDELPLHLHYGYRGDLSMKGGTASDGRGPTSGVMSPEESPDFAHLSASFLNATASDEKCSSLKLLSSRNPLRASEVDGLKWQSLLRVILPRLDVFHEFQRAKDIEGDLLASRYEREGVDNEGYTAVNFDYKFNILSSDSLCVRPYLSNLAALNKACGKNIDIDPSDSKQIEFVTLCLKAMTDIEEKEFFELDLDLKLVVLKVLVLTCYDCEAIASKIWSNNEQRQNQIAAANKLKWEEKKKLREVSNSKRDIAIERCRAINEREAAASQASESVKTGKSVQKKLNFKGLAPDIEDKTNAAPGGKKGKGSAKSSCDPSIAQLNAMLDEMVMLDAIGIDVVLPAAPELDEVSDDEDDIVLDDTTDAATKKLIYALSRSRSSGDIAGTCSRSQAKNSRERDRDRDRRRYDRAQMLRARESASYLIAQAAQTRREKDVREAIKASKAAGLQGVTENKQRYITEELKKVYAIQYQVEQENKEAAQTQKLEKALAELFVRTEPIGQDRYFRKYWCFEGDDRLFVQSEVGVTEKYMEAIDSGAKIDEVIPSKGKHARLSSSLEGVSSADQGSSQSKQNMASPATTASAADTSLELSIEMDMLQENALMMECNRPSRHEYSWAVFRSEADLWQLVEALDERGHRERALKNSIKARFDLHGEAPTPLKYLTEGSPYVGMKISRTFGKGSDKRVVVGLITGWLPADEEDPALWHVMHADGDEEDLEEKEVKKGLIGTPVSEDKNSIPENILVQEDATDQDVNPAEPKLTRARVASSKDDLKGEVEVEDRREKPMESDNMPYILATDGFLVENENYVPSFIRSYSNAYRGPLALKYHSIGPHGLRSEFLSLMTKLIEGLKTRASPFHKSGSRRIWENSVKEATSASEFAACLIELEAVVRGTQTIEDCKAEEELENMRREVQERLEAEGWIFSSEKLAESESYADALETVVQSLLAGAAEDSESSSSKKRKRAPEDDSDTSTDLKEGDILIPAFPKFRVPSGLRSVPSEFLDEVNKDVEGTLLIGTKIRRFFRNHSAPSDGHVVAYLPALLNDGSPLWHMLHEDGDEEDLDREEILKGMKAHEEQLLVPEIDNDYDGENQEEDKNDADDNDDPEEGYESDNDQEEDYEEEDTSSLNGGELQSTDPCSKRLWPSASVRAKWVAAVAESKTVSEIALAISILTQQCLDFGIMESDPDPNASGRRAYVRRSVSKESRKPKEPAGHKRRFSLTPMKPRAGTSSSRGRPPISSKNSSGGTPSKRGKKKKSVSRKSMGASESSRKHINSFGFFPDRPVRGTRRVVCYAE